WESKIGRPVRFLFRLVQVEAQFALGDSLERVLLSQPPRVKNLAHEHGVEQLPPGLEAVGVSEEAQVEADVLVQAGRSGQRLDEGGGIDRETVDEVGEAPAIDGLTRQGKETDFTLARVKVR